MLEFFRASARSLTDEHTLFACLTHAPDGSGTEVAALVTCHCGPAADAERAIRPLKQFKTPILDAVGQVPYCQLNSMLDANYPRGALNYWKSNFLMELSDAAIATMIESFARCPTPMGQLLLEHIHGAATRVDAGDSAFPHRQEGYNFLVLAQWMQPNDTSRCISWARETCGRTSDFRQKISMRIVKLPIGQRVKDDRGSTGDRLIRSSWLRCGSGNQWVGSKLQWAACWLGDQLELWPLSFGRLLA